MRSLLLIALLFIAVGAPADEERQVRGALWDPPAVQVHPDHAAAVGSPALTAELVAAGASLFRARFNEADGAGRPAATGDSKPTPRTPPTGLEFLRTSGPDANSCAGCHNQPDIGGSGDFVANVFVGAHFADPPALDIVPDRTNERNTIGVFGSGSVELLAREMSLDLQQQRDWAILQASRHGQNQRVELHSKGVEFGFITIRADGTIDASGLEGVDLDLVVRPFGAKGVAASLREFTIAALNQHHGIQAIERFGWERTGRRDFDEDGVEVELTIGQVSSLVLFQAVLPAPGRNIAVDADLLRAEERGESIFREVGCATCHKPSLPLESVLFTEPSPFNRPGTARPKDVEGILEVSLPIDAGTGLRSVPEGGFVVELYSDLRRHRICDAETPFLCNERLRQDNVPTNEFMTAKLWDLATSGPYCHRGDCVTISAAILAHGAEGANARRRFLALADRDKRALVAFLLSLGRKEGVATSVTQGPSTGSRVP